MRKIFVYITLVLLFSGVFANRVSADEYRFDDFHVTFDGTKIDSSDYDRAAVKEKLQGMQPGDNAELNFVLKNNYKDGVDWWMSNEAIKSFEKDARDTVNGGNYTYKLVYTDTKGNETELFNSAKVGGDTSNGLEDATNALDEMFLLENIGSGKTSRLTLAFELDGETQANNYQDTLGTIQVNFAVELPKDEPSKPSKRIVYIPYTGDTFNATYYIIAELLSLLLLAIVTWRYIVYRKKQEDVR